MSAITGIEWSDRTWNPTTGCDKVSPGCAHCYADGVANRFWAKQYPPIRIIEPNRCGTLIGTDRPRQFTDVQCHEDRLLEPLSWRKPSKVFVNSMSDLFHEDVSYRFVDRVFATMARAPQHTFQILTKRPARMLEYIAPSNTPDRIANILGWDFADGMLGRRLIGQDGGGNKVARLWPLPNVWLGVSVENQHFADERIPLLLQTPAAVRFISAEPLLGPVNLTECLGPRCHVCSLTATCFGVYDDCEAEPQYACDRCCGHGNEDGWCRPVSEGGISDSPRGLDWVIVGGESGPGARPCDLAWVRAIVQQCHAAGVACFVKQIGANPIWRLGNGQQANSGAKPAESRRCAGMVDRKGGDPAEWPEEFRVREFPVLRGDREAGSSPKGCEDVE